MATTYSTPGVYIVEKNAFPGSAVAVPTAVPVFIGYTEKASKDGKSLLNKPTKISSVNDFATYFGGAFKQTYAVAAITQTTATTKTPQQLLDDAAKGAIDAAKAAASTPADASAKANVEALAKNAIDAAAGVEDAAAKQQQDTVAKAAQKTLSDKVLQDAIAAIKAAATAAKAAIDPAATDAAKQATDIDAALAAATQALNDAQAAELAAASTPAAPLPAPAASVANKLTIDGVDYSIARSGGIFYLYNSINLFYSNGGADCYILSVGGYNSTPAKNDFVGDDVLSALEKEYAPTLVVMPDALLVDGCYNSIYTEVLAHCNKVQSRFAIFDIFNEDKFDSDNGVTAEFRTDIGTNFLNYGAAYYPWLKTTVVDQTDVDFDNISLGGKIANILNVLPAADQSNANATLKKLNWNDSYLGSQTDPKIISIKKIFHASLWASSATYKAIIKEINNRINVLPPSGAMAGLYTMVDTTRGVWKAPANYSLNAVNEPVVNISNPEQDGLNIDIIAGKSINVIRPFPGLGTLVWGGRTLDGNSQDWRYVNVRRTMIMIEQSLKLATRAYVFEPNDSSLWSSIKTMYSNFLTNLWKQGALAGAAPEQAFVVQVGLGTTMTADDILEGYLKITVLLAIVRPAEFIVITFQQQQQQS